MHVAGTGSGTGWCVAGLSDCGRTATEAGSGCRSRKPLTVLALDTNTLIYFFKGVGRVAEYWRSTAPREVAIPSIVVYELEVGIARSAAPDARRQALSALLQVVRVLPFDESCARAAAEVRTRLESAGTPIGPLDTLIAGTALSHSATLVTHNTREFSRVSGLRVVDWY